MTITPEGHHRYSIAEARRNFSALVRDAEAGRTVEISRRSVPVVAVIKLDSPARKAGPTYGEAYAEWVKDRDLAELDLRPEEVFVRDKSPGRDVKL